MSVLEKNLQVSMIREHLEDIAHFPLPEGFSVRWFQHGDENLWRQIQSESEPYFEIVPELFINEFGSDLSALGERQCFLYDRRNRPIGTATAWFNHDYNGLAYGRVHWVAIIPGMQGKGLSKPLMTIICNRLQELGHGRAYLTTSTMRLSAIGLYIIFGFAPEIKNAQDRLIWDELEQKLRTNLRD